MQIRLATVDDLEQLMEFYEAMCAVLGQQAFMPEGNKGGFPPRAMVEDAIKNKAQFILEADGRLAAAYILSSDCDPAYRTVHWGVDVPTEQASVMHALRVLPAYSGRGYAKALLEHAIRQAKDRGQKAFRLDVLTGNEIPIKMYLGYGFQYIDTVDITYPDIGIPKPFRLYELDLSKDLTF